MTNKEFTKSSGKLNSVQRQAVNTIEGAVMVIAGPGTGKTQILTLRIANILLNTQVNPENILALTFTESGAYSMRKRLVEIIGTPGYRVEINTFHGFCNELIKNNPEDFPHLIVAKNASELDQVQIIEEFISSERLKYLKPFGDPFYYVKSSLSAIDELKKEGISVDKFEKAVLSEEEDFNKIEDLYHDKGLHKGKMKGEYDKKLKKIQKNKELVKIYKAYDLKLKEKKLYDFSDMLLEVIKVLENNEQFLLSLQEKFQYILIDEHQDTNSAQNKIVELLCNFYDNPNLFVVGDEKQAIYRFQGASLENFLYFKKIYPKAVLLNLRDNYRSSQTILDASGNLISNNKITNTLFPEQEKLLARSKHTEKRIKIVATNDYYSEYYFVGNDIKKKIKSGIIPSEIAILARENRDLLPFVDVFKNLSIPFVVYSNQNVLQDREIQKLILLFTTVSKLGVDEYLIKAMHIACLNINPIDIYKLNNLAKLKKISLWELLNKGNFGTELDIKSQQEIKIFYKTLVDWKKLSHNESFDDLFKRILNESGLLKSILAKKNSLRTIDKITDLFENIKTNMERNPEFNLDDFMQYLDLINKHDIKINNEPRIIRKDAIRLMTVHKSKGLEFDCVYIVNVYDGHWGNQRSRSNSFSLPWDYLRNKLNKIDKEENNEDERRLFYVALTRARKEIFITYSSYGIDGKEQIASQFVNEVLDTYKKLISVEEFEKDFLSNKQIILSEFSQLNKNDRINEYLANKEYFAELFATKGFAATHLNNYLKCPWRYFFNNLISIPDVMNKHQIFGLAIHKALNDYLIYKKAKNKSVDFLLKSYYDALLNQPLTTQEAQELKGKGEEILKGYYKKYIKDWSKELIGELIIRGIKFSDKVTLTGRIDMIEKVKSSDVFVYDFKTGKPKSRNEIEGKTKSGDGDYKRQLVFYKILLDRYKLQRMNMIKGIIDFVEPTELGQYKREEFVISDEEVKDLEDKIRQVTDEILTMSYWNKRCEDKDCEYCSLRSYIGN